MRLRRRWRSTHGTTDAGNRSSSIRTTFSLTNYHEADRVEAEWRSLADRVDKLATELPEDERASYFELIQYPVDACANLTEMYIAAARNAADAKVGNPQANVEADEVRAMFEKDAALSDEYNHKLLDGKWDHMMDQTHIGYTAWNDPPANVMPAVSWIQVPDAGSLGVSAEDATFTRAGGRFGFSLGIISTFSDPTRTLTLFDRGRSPVEYKVETSAPWIVASETSGTVGATEQKVVLHVDWSKVPVDTDSAEGTVRVSSDDGRPMTYILREQRVNLMPETYMEPSRAMATSPSKRPIRQAARRTAKHIGRNCPATAKRVRR
jgi:hypothetical protein